jgi:hypothetical protein
MSLQGACATQYPLPHTPEELQSPHITFTVTLAIASVLETNFSPLEKHF